MHNSSGTREWYEFEESDASGRSLLTMSSSKRYRADTANIFRGSLEFLFCTREQRIPRSVIRAWAGTRSWKSCLRGPALMFPIFSANSALVDPPFLTSKNREEYIVLACIFVSILFMPKLIRCAHVVRFKGKDSISRRLDRWSQQEKESPIIPVGVSDTR